MQHRTRCGAKSGRLLRVSARSASEPKRRSRLACLACLSTAVVLFASAGAASSALAVVSGFGGPGEGAGQFAAPGGVAIDQESGDVFLADTGNGRVDKFASEGEFMLAFGGAVNAGTGGGICQAGEECQPGNIGTAGGGFGERPSGLAVDNSLGLSRGAVYVLDNRNLRVEKFSPEGKFLLAFGGEVNAVTHGEVCLSGEECQAGKAGTGPGEFEALGRQSIAVDPAGTVYVGDLERVQEFNAAGAVVGEVPLPGVGFIEALAVDSAKDIYVLGSAQSGVRKYDATGTELGEPRDFEASGIAPTIAVGPNDELFVSSPEESHVFEFTAAGEEVLSMREEGVLALAFSVGIQRLYLVHAASVDLVAVPASGPIVLEHSEAATEVLPTSAALGAIVNPEGGHGTVFHVDYGTSAAYGSSTPTEGLANEGGFEDEAVQASVSGLSPETVYHFRVVAKNEAGQTTLGPDQTFTTLPPISILSETASQVTARSARLTTALNAHGLATHYRFEYGPTAGYGEFAPVPDGDAGAGSGDVTLPIFVEGLQPDTVYHYRVTAENTLGRVHGPDRTFSTQAASTTGVADGRVWEMVSPPDKHGVSLESMSEEGSVIQAADDGSKFTYVAKAPVDPEPSGSRSVTNTQLLSQRAAENGGWSTTDIATPHEEVSGVVIGNLSEYRLFSSDLSYGFVEPEGATPLAKLAGERTPYRRESDGSYVPLVNPGNTREGAKFGGEELNPGEWIRGLHFVTAAADGRHAIVRSPETLTPLFSNGGVESLYEWGAGVLRQVSVLPDGRAASEEGATSAIGNGDNSVRNAVSADGSRIVFEAAAEAISHLYVRDVGRSETVQLDVPRSGARGGNGSAVFQTASSDGTEIFFTDEARLTRDATSTPGKPDLYRCELVLVSEHDTCTLKDLSIDGTPGEAADVQGDVIGVDTTGRYVYFVANGGLVAGATHGECSGSVHPGEQAAGPQCNLYTEDAQSGEIHLVAVLSTRDGEDWASVSGADLSGMTAVVSGNGRFLAFLSERSLTGFDNRDAHSGEPDVEVFLFEKDSGKLRCVSCNSTGARPVGAFDEGKFPGLLVDRSATLRGQWLAGLLPGWTRVDLGHSLYEPRALSDTGRLFFDSPVGLVPGDANGKMDVYEYDPTDMAGCGREEGCVGLVSSGTSSEESAFLDASSGGGDAFIMTSARLAGADTDGALDVYDAHECSTAVPCPAGLDSVPPACSTTDSCRSAPPPQPETFGPPPSATFSGNGNVTGATSVVKPLTRQQKLAKALRACRTKRQAKSKRAACERRARKRYGRTQEAKRKSRGRAETRRGGHR